MCQWCVPRRFHAFVPLHLQEAVSSLRARVSPSSHCTDEVHSLRSRNSRRMVRKPIWTPPSNGLFSLSGSSRWSTGKRNFLSANCFRTYWMKTVPVRLLMKTRAALWQRKSTLYPIEEMKTRPISLARLVCLFEWCGWWVSGWNSIHTLFIKQQQLQTLFTPSWIISRGIPIIYPLPSRTIQTRSIASICVIHFCNSGSSTVIPPHVYITSPFSTRWSCTSFRILANWMWSKWFILTLIDDTSQLTYFFPVFVLYTQTALNNSTPELQ